MNNGSEVSHSRTTKLACCFLPLYQALQCVGSLPWASCVRSSGKVARAFMALFCQAGRLESYLSR